MTPTDLESTLDRLAELQAKATKGPWKFDPENYGTCHTPGVGLIDGSDSSLGVTVHDKDVLDRIYPNADDNSRLIVAARNTDFAALAAEVRRMTNECREQRERLDREAHHQQFYDKPNESAQPTEEPRHD